MEIAPFLIIDVLFDVLVDIQCFRSTIFEGSLHIFVSFMLHCPLPQLNPSFRPFE